MTQVQRKVKLKWHTQISEEYRHELEELSGATGAQLLALTAIRTCYSPGKPSEIVAKEGARYLRRKASDGGEGTDADRLIRMIHSSGHTSTYEGITFNFTVEGVSRALLAQLTRHRVGTGFSVQSQRYVKFGSEDRSGGFDYVVPGTITDDKVVYEDDEQKIGALELLTAFMEGAQETYDLLRKAGVPAEDARAVLPNATACNLVLTFNLRAFLDFYGKRQHGKGAQSEIADLADELKAEIIKVEPWVTQLFESEAV